MADSRPALPSKSARLRPYPEYKDSGVKWLGEIPAHWTAGRVKECASVLLSNVDKKVVEGEPRVRLCNYTDVYYQERIDSRLDFMQATASPEQVRRFSLKQGDVLITKDSETWMDIAVPAVVAEDLPGVLCGYHLALIRPRPHCLGAFLGATIGAVGLQDQYRVSANGVTRFGLTGNAIRNGVLPLPPLAEQQAIADFLDREAAKIDALVARQERLIDLLEEKRTALISYVVTKGLDPDVPTKDSGVEWLGEIPAHWEAKKWRYCCRVADDGQVAPDEEQYRDRVLIAPDHVEPGTGRIHHMETAHDQGAISGKYLVKPGDIIYSKIRPALNKVCFSTGNWLCSADMYPVSITESRLETRFLLYFMLSRPFVRLMVDESMRVAMPKVNRKKLADVRILIADPAEQRAITNFLDRELAKIDELIVRARQASEHLEEFRNALISAAVTGKIDVREVAA